MNYKLLYVIVMVVFLPAYTQVKDTMSKAPKNDSPLISVADSIEIERIKTNAKIDAELIKIRLLKMKVADSINNIKDSLALKDTCHVRAKQ